MLNAYTQVLTLFMDKTGLLNPNLEREILRWQAQRQRPHFLLGVPTFR